jgi:hypothetical protein
MRVLIFLSMIAASLLLAPPAAIGRPDETVAEGVFRFWKPSDGVATWTSAGVRIRIEPAPCRTPPQTEGCSFDHINNQPLVTVTVPGLSDYRTLGDSQASFYRIAVARLQSGDVRPGVVLENQSGGSGGNVREQILLPDGTGFREQFLPGYLQGELPAKIVDLSGDGVADFVLGDGAFDSAFGCNACSPRPPVVLSFRNGVAVDVSREHAYAGIFRREMAKLRVRCFDRSNADRNGSCAAYVAVAARAGRYPIAWRQMLRHYNPHGIDFRRGCDVPRAQWPEGDCPAGHQTPSPPFPESLAAFLRAAGYID